jgi:hypothetical protein
MDLFTGALIVGAAWAFLGGKKKNGNGQVWDVPDIDEGEATDDNGRVTEKEEEPDYQPGPIDKKELLPPDDTFIKQLEALVPSTPTANRFFHVFQGGPNASDLARTVLSAAGANSGSNRVALIKCMTQIPWNDRLYASTREAASWGTMFNVAGKNLSAAWMPRNANALPMMGAKQLPNRNIAPNGSWLGGEGTSYGLVWIPKIQTISGKLVCDPLAEGPPAWLTDALK